MVLGGSYYAIGKKLIRNAIAESYKEITKKTFKTVKKHINPVSAGPNNLEVWISDLLCSYNHWDTIQS